MKGNRHYVGCPIASDSSADCFRILSELEVIEEPLVENLQRMARFRNLLVHLYRQVDDRRVYEIIRRHLSDLDAFREQIACWLLNFNR